MLVVLNRSNSRQPGNTSADVDTKSSGKQVATIAAIACS